METQLKILMNDAGIYAKEIIDLLHKENIHVIYLATSAENDPGNADEFFVYEEYNYQNLKFCAEDLLDLCLSFNIDVFIPMKDMTGFDFYKEQFIENNITIISANNLITDSLNNINTFYDLLKDIAPELIPEYYIVSNRFEFEEACEQLRKNNKNICMKYTHNGYNNDFYIIDFGKKTFVKPHNKTKVISYEKALDMFISEPKYEIAVMEYIDNEKITCNCLKTKNENIIFSKHSNVANYCDEILENINYKMPVKISFKKNLNNEFKIVNFSTKLSEDILKYGLLSNTNIPTLVIKNFRKNINMVKKASSC